MHGWNRFELSCKFKVKYEKHATGVILYSSQWIRSLDEYKKIWISAIPDIVEINQIYAADTFGFSLLTYRDAMNPFHPFSYRLPHNWVITNLTMMKTNADVPIHPFQFRNWFPLLLLLSGSRHWLSPFSHSDKTFHFSVEFFQKYFANNCHFTAVFTHRWKWESPLSRLSIQISNRQVNYICFHQNWICHVPMINRSADFISSETSNQISRPSQEFQKFTEFSLYKFDYRILLSKFQMTTLN